jgi:hypothetical protein
MAIRVVKAGITVATKKTHKNPGQRLHNHPSFLDFLSPLRSTHAARPIELI